jgi:hypothetical protein
VESEAELVFYKEIPIGMKLYRLGLGLSRRSGDGRGGYIYSWPSDSTYRLFTRTPSTLPEEYSWNGSANGFLNVNLNNVVNSNLTNGADTAASITLGTATDKMLIIYFQINNSDESGVKGAKEDFFVGGFLDWIVA